MIKWYQKISRKELVAISISTLIIGFAFGAGVGYSSGINFCLDIAQKILDSEGINVTIREDLINRLINFY